MKRSIVIGLALATAVAVPAFAGESYRDRKPVHHRHAYRHLHRVVQPPAITPSANGQASPGTSAPTAFPTIKPYPDGKGDEDGLSRSINDCNKGCIGGNPG